MRAGLQTSLPQSFEKMASGCAVSGDKVRGRKDHGEGTLHGAAQSSVRAARAMPVPGNLLARRPKISDNIGITLVTIRAPFACAPPPADVSSTETLPAGAGRRCRYCPGRDFFPPSQTPR